MKQLYIYIIQYHFFLHENADIKKIIELAKFYVDDLIELIEVVRGEVIL
jgi:hypothetical protein